jgi:hypothetical protein
MKRKADDGLGSSEKRSKVSFLLSTVACCRLGRNFIACAEMALESHTFFLGSGWLISSTHCNAE